MYNLLPLPFRNRTPVFDEDGKVLVAIALEKESSLSNEPILYSIDPAILDAIESYEYGRVVRHSSLGEIQELGLCTFWDALIMATGAKPEEWYPITTFKN